MLIKTTHNKNPNTTVIEIIKLALWQSKDSGGINTISDLGGFPELLSASFENSGSQT